MELLVHVPPSPATAALPFEVVERKGRGHPDTLCDGIAESVSRALCLAYRERFGAILHHNVDKVLLVGGGSNARFGGGEVTEPIEIYLAGRATSGVSGESLAIDEIAVEACKAHLRRTLHHLDVERHVRIVPKLRKGSADLVANYEHGGAVPRANDTSIGVGFAPLTPLERSVLAVERALVSDAARAACPAIGEDVKVMGVRASGRLSLTVGCAMIAAHVPDLAAYRRAKEIVASVALEATRNVTGLPVEVVVNAADDLARGDLYLTVTGTSAEAGDDGEVGRGNRANGLITPYRPMTLEAAAGKNPVTHVGKLYNLVASRIAAAIAAEWPGVEEASLVLVSRIGRSVADPGFAEARLVLREGELVPAMRARIGELVHEGLTAIPSIREELLAGRLEVV